ncbi:MAG: winged helix-turn-helix transcriptional regulator [Thermoplasmata archaeon]
MAAEENERNRLENKRKACMIKNNNSEICIDPSLPLLNLIGKKYTMMVLGVIGNDSGKRNFNEILDDIPFSSSTIISKRLKDLEKAGIIIKNNDADGITYSLTELGNSIRKALIPLLKLMEKS